MKNIISPTGKGSHQPWKESYEERTDTLLAYCIVLDTDPGPCHAGNHEVVRCQVPATDGSQLASCRTCHMPTLETCLNSYALLLKENGLDFSAIEQSDADGDGVVALDEIRTHQLPGSQAQADEIFLFTNRIGAITFNHENHSLADSYLSKGKCANCHSEETFPRKFDDKKHGNLWPIRSVKVATTNRAATRRRNDALTVMTNRTEDFRINIFRP